jgi:hypothetical protein
MEWWIIAGLLLAAVAVGVVNRIRKARRDAAQRDGNSSIYPLW